MANLNKKDKLTLSSFKEKINEALKNKPRLILFGSKARGDSHSSSDLDVLVILNQLTPEKRQMISDIATDAFLKDGVDISPHIYSQKEYKELLSLQTPFMLSVKEEGLVI